MKKFYLSIALFCVIVMSGCNNKPKSHEELINGQCAIMIPNFMNSSKEAVNDSNAVAYICTGLQSVMVMRHDNKAEVIAAIGNAESEEGEGLLGKHGKLMTQSYLGQFEVVQSLDQVDAEIDGLPAKLCYIVGENQGSKLFFMTAFIEGEEQLYQYTAMMPYKKGNTQREIFDDIIYSFRELR